MKRLQFRHNNTIFENREVALKYFSDIVDSNNVASLEFKSSLYAEPMVARYLDEDGNTQVIFAIGVDSGLTPYHIIDIKEVSELIAKNEGLITDEVERAINAENLLQKNIDDENKRALSAEAKLSESIIKEINDRTNAVSNLQEQITNNISSINQVTPSSANILAEYALKNAKGEVLGDNIKIYKDSSLVGSLIGFKGAENVVRNDDGTFTLSYNESERDENVEYLYLVYRNEEGNLQLVGIDFENFLMEAEFKDGLNVINHSVSVKIKDGERYLGVNENGIYTTNINEDINNAVLTLNETLVEKLNSEITRATSKEEEIVNTVNTFSASVVSEVNKVNENIITEKTRAELAETNLQTLINDEKNRATAMESNLQNNIDAEKSRAELSENKLQEAINTEKLERQTTDEELRTLINSNKITSKDIVVERKDNTGTTLSIQTDEITITKYKDYKVIAETGRNILGSLLTIKKVASDNPAIKSRYELQGGDEKIIGDAIEIPVESSLISVIQGKEGDTIDQTTGNYISYGEGDTTMNFIYRLANGSYELAQIKVSDYFTDSHFGEGLNNQDGVISLVPGDGNEYLVIGKDTISVVGVDNAILNAKNQSIAYTEDKFNVVTENIEKRFTENKNYTDNRYNETTGYTDAQINLVNENINKLTNTINTSVESMNSTLNNAIDSFNNNLSNQISNVQGSLDSEVTNRENADNELHSRINTITDTINNLSVEDERLNSKISATNETIKTLESSINHKFEDTVNNITQAYTNADNTILQASKEYTDNVKGITINEINSSKVRDIKYNSGEKKIYLEYSNGTYSEGFDASDFLIDGILKNVSFNEVTNEITFEWNVGVEDKTITINLEKFIDIYTRNEDSESFLKINGNKISAIVDKNDGRINTLATTNYVNSSIEDSLINVKSEISNSINENNKTLNQSIETNKLNIEGLKKELQNDIKELETEVNSVDSKISEKISKEFAVNGVDISDITIDSNSSLLYRAKNANGDVQYFVPNDAKNIIYGDKSITAYIDELEAKNADFETENNRLNEEVISLKAEIEDLEEKINGLNNGIVNYGQIQSLVISDIANYFANNFFTELGKYVSGTSQEIKVGKDGNKLIIGFDDNAIFGDIPKTDE
jgi:hypothetical protein